MTFIKSPNTEMIDMVSVTVIAPAPTKGKVDILPKDFSFCSFISFCLFLAASSKKAKKVSTRTTARQTASKAENTKKEKAPSSSGNAPRVSVRRERH